MNDACTCIAQVSSLSQGSSTRIKDSDSYIYKEKKPYDGDNNKMHIMAIIK